MKISSFLPALVFLYNFINKLTFGDFCRRQRRRRRQHQNMLLLLQVDAMGGATLERLGWMARRRRRKRRTRMRKSCSILRWSSWLEGGGEVAGVRRRGGEKECVLCLEEDVTSWRILRPCGHACCCSECAKTLSCCPICRAITSETWAVFLRIYEFAHALVYK